MEKLKNLFSHYFSYFFVGAIMTLAFAPFNVWPLAILCPAILFYRYLCLHTKLKKTFLAGFLFGLGFFTTSVSWVYISLHVFGGMPLIIAIFFTILFVMFLALFPALTGLLLNRIFTPAHKFIYLLAFVCIFVMLEWLRSHLLSGFPWVLLAYSQINSPLAGFAPIVGEIGVNSLVIFLSGLFCYACLKNYPLRWLYSLFILCIFGLGAFLKMYSWTVPMNPLISISMVQAAVPQSMKWVPEQFIATIKTYTELTNPLTSDLIIWPEAAVTLPKNLVEDYLQTWQEKLADNDQTLLLGIPIKETDKIYYNGLITVGKNQGTYLKRHLVPFGEYPFLAPLSQYVMNYLHIPMANFSEGALHQPLITIGHAKIANFICYEVAFEHLVLADFPAANLIVNISDDSWFGHSLAAWQQLQIGQFRALETEREGLFSTNDGITAIVNQKGKIIDHLPRYKTTVLSGKVQPRQGSTPIMLIGSYRMLLGVGFLLIILPGICFIKRKSAK